MPRNDHSSAIALVLSLLLHGSALYLCQEAAVPITSEDRPSKAAIRPVRSRILMDSAIEPPTPVKTKPLPPSPPEVVPPAAPEPSLATVLPTESKPIIPLELAPPERPLQPPTGFGELSGRPDATAMHSLSGDVPMQAPKAEQDQPYISRDPVGSAIPAAPPVASPPLELPPAVTPEVKSEPAKSRPAENTAVVQASRELSPQAPVKTLEVDPTRYGPRTSATAPSVLPVQIAMADAPRAPAQVAPKMAEEVARPQSAVVPSETMPLTPSPSQADGAPQTDSESDPFSVTGTAEFRPGKVTARFGRKVKTVRPRLSLAGQYDLISASPQVVMRVRADETGRVREVKVVQSSGSREVDQPCVLAMYDWWFEPPRDPAGNPRAAEMLWTISFRAR